jgi:hypothetical protein
MKTRNVTAVVVGCLLVSACSLGIPDLPSIQFVPPAETSTPVATWPPTSTPAPTQPTATFTLTPTRIGEKSPTPSPTIASTATAGPGALTATPRRSPTATLDLGGLASLRVSTDHFYAGGCQPEKVSFSVQVADPARVAFVVLFARFKGTVTGVTSPWTSITMESLGAGKHSHDLVAAEMEGFGFFDDPWVQYQIVTTTADSQVLSRTQVFDEMLTLITSCVPTPTAASGS